MLVVVGVATATVAWTTEAASQPGTLTISYAFSPDADGLLVGLITEFNREGHRVDGRTVEIIAVKPPGGTAPGVSSGQALDGMLDGALRPDAWTPASSLWGELLDARSDSPRVAASVESLVQSPQVVASIDGSGSRPGTLEEVFNEVRSGALKFAHTDPNISTSGLSLVLAEFYLAANKMGQGSEAPLRRQDVANAQHEAERVEQRVAHYVDIANSYRTQWCEYGAFFAKSVYMQETTYFGLKREFEQTCNVENVGAMYPTDVPLVADYPYYVVEAPWVDSHQREAARFFGEWLDTTLRENCDLVTSEGYHKVPSCHPEDSRPFSWEPDRWLPEPDVLRDVQLAWDEIRRPANLVIVLERTDERMNADQLHTLLQILANDGANDFATCPRSQDRVALFPFGNKTPTPRSLDPYDADEFRHNVAQLGQRQYGRQLGTFSDALSDAVDLLEKQDDGPMNTIVLLAWGDGDPVALDSLAKAMRDEGHSPPQIVAALFGEESELEPIKGVVKASLGRYEFFAPEQIEVGAVAEFVCQFL